MLVTKREKRACRRCEEQGVETAALPARIIPKSLVSDRVIIDTVVSKYCDHLPLYRLDRRGIEYEALDNGISWCEDLAAAQRICDRFDQQKIEAFFRKCCLAAFISATTTAPRS